MTPSASRRVRATATCSTRPGWPSRGPPATRSPTRRRRTRAAARVEGRERSMANAIQLNRANLKSIAGRAQVPSFDPAGVPGSIVHVGVGGFHRAHQAVYLRSEEHTSELQSLAYLVCRLLLEKKKKHILDEHAINPRHYS